MKIQRVYLDLDRTMLDTERFVKALFKATEQLYGIPATTMQREVPDFYYATGQLRHYDFFEHLFKHGITRDEARTGLRAALAGQDFLFAGAAELLQFLATQNLTLHVLSFGKTDYQKFKYSFLPALRHIPITIIFEEKDVYLAAQSALPTLLVDDKITWPLPTWCTQLLFDPSAPQPVTKENAQVWRINKLSAVETYLTVGYNVASNKGPL